MGPFISGFTNTLELINGWVRSDNNMEAASRSFGAEFGLRAATFADPAVRRAIRDGHVSQRELAAINQVLEHATQELDQRGVTDPALRADTLIRAVNSGASVGLRRIHEHNEPIRAAIRERE